MNRKALDIANIVLALAQFPVSAFSRITGKGLPIEAMSARAGMQPPEVPAGYAFGIWIVIFLFASFYSLGAAQSRFRTAATDAIAPLLTGVLVCGNAWMLIAQLYGDSWILVALIVTMWVCAVRALLRLHDVSAPTRFECKLALSTIGLYAGWLTAAMFLNLTTTLASTQGTFGLTPDIYALLTLVPATGVAGVLLLRTGGNLWYGGAVLWAVIGIAVANLLNVSGAPLVFAAACVIAMALAAGTAGIRHGKSWLQPC